MASYNILRSGPYLDPEPVDKHNLNDAPKLGATEHNLNSDHYAPAIKAGNLSVFAISANGSSKHNLNDAPKVGAIDHNGHSPAMKVVSSVTSAEKMSNSYVIYKNTTATVPPTSSSTGPPP